MNGQYTKHQPWPQVHQHHPPQPFHSQPPQLENEFFSSLAGANDFPAEAQASYRSQAGPIASSSSSGPMRNVYDANPQQAQSRTSSTSYSPSSSLDGAFGSVYAGFTGPVPPNGAMNPSAFVQPVQNNQHVFDFHPPSNVSLNPGQDTGSNLVNPYITHSPDPLHATFPPSAQQQRIPTYQPFSPPGTGTNKRARQSGDDIDDGDDEDSAKEEAKPKANTACSRCKSLKVRCEGRTETSPCKRCRTSGNPNCVLPGRKKRRTPPKREDLMNRIVSQGEEIKRLMAQLEAMNKQSDASDTGSSSAAQSPVVSPARLRRGSLLGSEGESSNNVDPETQQVVADWITKARESFQEFDGFIAGGGLPRSYIVGQEAEEGYSSDEELGEDLSQLEVGGEGQDYEFTVEGAEPSPRSPNGSTLHRTPSNSSLGSAATPRRRSPGRSLALPTNAAAFGLFSDLALKKNRLKGGSNDEEEEAAPAGIASNSFFESAPLDRVGAKLAEKQHPTPHILARRLITPAEAEKLFHTYFTQMNLSVSLLDPVMYTAQRTYYRSPFLFTVVCAIASRFSTERPELYAQAMHYAQLAAGTALISGKKNVEMVSAYILLSLYPVPAKRWEDQRSWLYLGLAIRCATDLNLHIPNTAKPINEIHAREMLNRTRVWLNCFNVDRSTGSQYGKPPIINNADYVANHSDDWWQSSPYNMKHFDIHICAYNAELRVMAKFLGKIYNNPEHPSGLNQDVDLESIASQTDDELQALGAKWFSLLEKTDMNDSQNSFRTGLLKLAYSYARLGCLSYGFQRASSKGQNRENPFLQRCLSAATDVVHAVLNNTCGEAQVSYLRHGPEAQSVFVTFASAFLVKLLQPKFSAYLTIDQREEIRNLVQKIIDLLGSPEVAMDNKHGPKLYSRFLKGLLAAPMARDPAAASPASSTSSRKQRTPKSPGHLLERTPSMTPPPETSPPQARSSLSPAPAAQAASFDLFAPDEGGAIDPYSQMYISTNEYDPFGSGNSWMYDTTMTDVLEPLPWGDVPAPHGLNLMTTIQDNLGLNMQQEYNNSLFMNP